MIMLHHASVRYTEDGCVSHFRDGTFWGAQPHPENPHYHVISHRLGYGDDLLTYAREHEVCHHLVEEFLYDRPSRVIWSLAHGDELSPSGAAYEEMAAMALQRFLRAGERPIVAGVDWDELLALAQHKLGMRP